ncbi:hypothetical protein J6590_023802, partial [Homalodisca vitripennis]
FRYARDMTSYDRVHYDPSRPWSCFNTGPISTLLPTKTLTLVTLRVQVTDLTHLSFITARHGRGHASIRVQ